jgi:anti-anti-sigma regulatory factor
MVIVSTNIKKQVLVITFAGRVEAKQVEAAWQDVVTMVGELKPAFRVLADLTSLEWMSEDCAHEIAKVMDLCAEKRVGLIIRVIPDKSKDIGLSILSRFHYPNKPRMIICEKFAEVEQYLESVQS